MSETGRLVDFEGALEKALSRIEGHAAYADILAESSGGFRLRVDRTVTTPSPQPTLQGATLRAWTGDRWTETVARNLETAELEHAADHLIRDLSRSPGRNQPPPGPSPTGNLEFRTETARPLEDVPLEEQVELARHWFQIATETPGISNAFTSLGYFINDRLFRSTSGARRFQSVQRVLGSVVPIATENGRVEYDALTEGATGGFELYQRFTEEAIRSAARNAVELLTSAAPPVGRMPVLLDPSTAGTFAHESFGHGSEADQFLRDRSYLKPLFGQSVGPEGLTLVDDGGYPNAWGTLGFDDEGTPTQHTVLVDRGRFVEVLHDRETAHALGRRTTGNARRADFLSRTFVRMTNTFVEPGDFSLEELVKEAGDGILLERCTSGIEDPLGGQMQIKVKRARRIEHGTLTEAYSGMALSGRVLDFLKAIRGIGRAEYFSISPGLCGKGHTDLLPAGTGGTYLLSEAVVGPA
ncbi:MAG: TldD/PmbA family protein [Thermoplasmata archaeon]